MAKQNGTGVDRLTSIIDELQAELAAEDLAVAQVEAVLQETRSKRARIQRAIDALTGTKAKAARPAARKGGWTISDTKVEQVRALIAAKSQPVTVRELATEGGMATESARRSLEVLRERELVRFAGKRAGRGGGQKLYMPMPELTDAG